MSNISVDYDVLNQKQTPAFYASSLATRPTFGYPGRIFIDTDSPSSGIYRDTGSAWVQVADPGAGTTGTLQQVTTNGNTTTLAIQVQGIDISKGAGTGVSNTAVGTSALSINTTGSINVAVGYQALQNNTTGYANIGIGQQSLLNNSTGNSNTGVGNGVLSSNTTGTQNTAIGSGALVSNTTANYNTAIGTNSLAANTTGYSNTGVGQGTLLANTTGGGNTTIGFNSLAGNLTGNYNTAIGVNSLNSNLNGASNVSIGYNSLASSTSSNNTAIGVQSLYITTGANNVAIGYNSGNAITTGSNNSILGSYIGTATLTSNIVLSDGAGNVRLFSDANGLIGINQAVGSVPGGQIDIHTAQTYALVLNGLTTNNAYTAFSNNSVGKWRIGNTYNAGANTFDVYNLGTSSNAISINSTTNALSLIGSISATQFILSGATSPSGLYYNSGINRVTIANYSATGSVLIETGGGTAALSLASNQEATFSSSVTAQSLGIANGYYLVGRNAANTAFRTLVTFDSANKILIGQDSDITAITLGVGSEAMRITSGGNVGIGTSNPTHSLQIGNSTSSYYIKIASTLTNTFFGSDGVGTYIGNDSSQPIRFDTNATEKMRITSGGNVLIGTTTDSGYKLDVNGTGRFSGQLNIIVPSGIAKMQIGDSSVSGGCFINLMGISAAKTWFIANNYNLGGGLEFLQSTTNGGTTPASTAIFSIASTGAATFSNLAGTGSRAVLADANGLLSAPVSDISVKQNIKPIGYGLNEILKMNPVWFNFIDEYKNFGQSRQNGNIAQEMEIIIPESVFTTPSTGKMGINYDQLHAVYIKAIQELNEKVNRLYINHYGQ